MIAISTLLAVVFAYPVISSGKLFRRQDLSGVPECGQTCLITAATTPAIVGSCSLADVPCLCDNAKFLSSVTTCALSACSSQDQAKMLTWATATCPKTTSTTPTPSVSIPGADAGVLAGLPGCGQNCVVDTASNNAGGCSPTDVACLCKNSQYIGAVKTCVASKCSLGEASTMLTWSTTACSADAKSPDTPTKPAPAATSTAAATAPSQTSDPVAPSDTNSSSAATTNTTQSATGNTTSVVTVTYTSVNSSQAPTPATADKSGSLNNSTESSSSATVLSGPGCLFMASVLIPSMFL